MDSWGLEYGDIGAIFDYKTGPDLAFSFTHLKIGLVFQWVLLWYLNRNPSYSVRSVNYNFITSFLIVYNAS